MGDSFIAPLNADKYVAHLPQLMNMYKNKNPFINQNYAYIPITETDTNYAFPQFGQFPFFAWSFLPFMPLSRLIPLEILIRSLCSLLGIVIIFLFYLLLEQLRIGKLISFLIITIFVFNPVFQLMTYLTVMDTPGIIFLLLALLFFQKGKEALAYFCGGLAVLMKYSFLLVLLPTLILLILLEKKDKFAQLAQLSILSFIPYFLFNLLIKNTPSVSLPQAYLRIALFFFLLYFTYLASSKIAAQLQKFPFKKTLPIQFLGLGILILGLFLVFSKKISGLGPEFLTDKFLIFNFLMYNKLFEQIKEMTNSNFFLILAISIPFSFLQSKRRNFTVSLLIGAVTYLILASKSIYFHVYYKHIFLLLFLISFGNILQFIAESRLPRLGVASLIVFATIFCLSDNFHYLPHFFKANKEASSGIREVATYLREHTNKKDKIIGLPILGLYCDRAVLDPTDNSLVGILRFSSLIKEGEVCQIMQEVNVKYFVTTTPHSPDELSSFLFGKQKEISSRTERILTDLGQLSILEKINQVYSQAQNKTEFTPEKVFKLEKVIENWYIYSTNW